jgi:Initiator Replication protein.
MTIRRITLIENGDVGKCSFSFNNLLLRSPLRYTMMERRFLYKLSEAIKMRYEEMGLTMRDNWQNLVFNMTDRDLASVGGNTNVMRTYKTVRSLAQKAIVQFHENEDKQLVVDYFHWIDAFRWNTSTNDYTVRVSPELYDYVINLTKSFTVLNLHTAILLESKYSQKFYEICYLYSGDFRFIDPTTPDETYKKRVLKMSIEAFRFTFGLSELHDPKTGELLEKEKYQRFKTMVEKVILPAQRELYALYKNHLCDVWFDFEVLDRYGRGRNGSPKNLRFYIYSREFPKSNDAEMDRPWQEGDAMLFPYEEKALKKAPKEKTFKQTDWLSLDGEFQRDTVRQLLKSYLDNDAADYYITRIDEEQRQSNDTYSQVIQVIYEKQKQAKFQQGTKKYKQKCLIDFVFAQNLKEYGWSIPPYSPE